MNRIWQDQNLKPTVVFVVKKPLDITIMVDCPVSPVVLSFGDAFSNLPLMPALAKTATSQSQRVPPVSLVAFKNA